MQTFAANWTPDSDASGNTILFAAQQLDSVTGLYYMRARWYSPLTGDFITRDPLGFAAGDANLYRYAGGNPISRSDPSGLAWNPSGGGGGVWDGGGAVAAALNDAAVANQRRRLRFCLRERPKRQLGGAVRRPDGGQTERASGGIPPGDAWKVAAHG